jgi:subtilisin family serine protease
MKSIFNKILKVEGILLLIFLISLLFTYSCQEKFEEPSTLEDAEVMMYQKGDIIPGQYIVVLNNGAVSLRKTNVSYETLRIEMKSQVVSLLSKYRISETQLNNVYVATIEGFALQMNEDQLAALRNDPMVAYIEPDRVVSIAQKGNKPGGGGTSPSSQEIPWGIDRVGGTINYTGSNVAWVLDTGIDLDHPDLNVNGAKGLSVFTSGKDASLDDGNGHGTHVAGTIAAINNGIGVVGVAAGAEVIPVKVLNSRGSGSISGVIQGVDFVAVNGKSGDVANMSLGGGVSEALDNAVIAAAGNGIKFALAAGNESKNANLTSPARANGTNIYTISAMNSSNIFASFSNFGNPPIDYCAPGVSIKSTWKDGGYNTISGTSMAAPHAAGVLLLGLPKSSVTVSGDPDGNPDNIISR